VLSVVLFSVFCCLYQKFCRREQHGVVLLQHPTAYPSTVSVNQTGEATPLLSEKPAQPNQPWFT
jgi:hypothetical protein